MQIDKKTKIDLKLIKKVQSLFQKRIKFDKKDKKDQNWLKLIKMIKKLFNHISTLEFSSKISCMNINYD